jgi:hypothetical protein
MNRGQIRDKARVLIEEYGEEIAWEDEELDHLIDLSYKKVSSYFMRKDDSLYVKSANLNLEANKPLYDLADDFLRLKDLYNEDDYPIFRLYNPALRYKFLGQGNVVVYYFQGKQLGLLDIPSAGAIYPYNYVYIPAALTSDESTPDVPEYLGHELICHDVAIKALDLDEETSSTLVEETKELRKQIEEIYYTRSTDFPRQSEGDEALDDLD